MTNKGIITSIEETDDQNLIITTNAGIKYRIGIGMEGVRVKKDRDTYRVRQIKIIGDTILILMTGTTFHNQNDWNKVVKPNQLLLSSLKRVK